MSAVIAARWVTGPDGPAFLPKPVCCFEFTIRSTPPELAGWTQAVRELKHRIYIREGQRVGFIVDSDLRSLEAYNRRERPLADGDLLPEGIYFVYPSSDTGMDNVANRLIRMSDDASGQILTQIKSGRIAPAQEKPFGPFDAFRQIRLRNIL